MATLVRSEFTNQNMHYIKMTVVDSDDDKSNVFDALGAPFKVAGNLSLLVIRVSGADNTVDVVIEISNDGLNWTTGLQETDVTGGASETTIATGKIARFYRIDTPDVGASGTLSIFAVIN